MTCGSIACPTRCWRCRFASAPTVPVDHKTVPPECDDVMSRQQHAARDEVEMGAKLERLVRLPGLGGECRREQRGERGDGLFERAPLLCSRELRRNRRGRGGIGHGYVSRVPVCGVELEHAGCSRSNFLIARSAIAGSTSK